MAWVKLDDAMPTHPKVMVAGPQAFALDVAGIAYSNRYGTDGFIADSVLPAVLPCLSQPGKWAKRLAVAGRWERDDDNRGWLIHDIGDYQPSAADQEKERAEARERMQRVRGNRQRSSGDVRANNPRTFGGTNAEVHPKFGDPVPSRPVPIDRYNTPNSLVCREDGTERDPRVIHALELLADSDLEAGTAAGRVRVPDSYRRTCLDRRITDDANALDQLADQLPGANPQTLLETHMADRYLDRPGAPT